MTDDTPQKPAASEPSMEDILASIRRILAEDSAQEADKAATQELASSLFDDLDAEEPQPESEPGTNEAADELGKVSAEPPEIQQMVDTSQPPRADVFVLTPNMRVAEAGVAAPTEARPLTTPGEPRMAAAAAERRIVSTPAAEVSADVLSHLAKAILDRRDIAVTSRDVTLEGMVREMLRPLLREWLDRNLPYLIERLVKKEIDLMVNRAERLDD